MSKCQIYKMSNFQNVKDSECPIFFINFLFSNIPVQTLI